MSTKPFIGDEPVPGYRLLKFRGQGNVGPVWEAIGPGGTRAAIKFIQLDKTIALKEFRAVQTMKMIRQVHLAEIFAIWARDESGAVLSERWLENWASSVRPQDATITLEERRSTAPMELILAMQLADFSLADRLKEYQIQGLPGIPPLELLDYLDGAGRAVDFLNSTQHDLGSGPIAIQHGDIKPANILVRGGAAQVCDFGLARVMSSVDETGARAFAGSPAYASPETFDGHPCLASDQYALAITYVELRTGRLPFVGSPDDWTFEGVLNAHKKGKLDLSRLPADERAVIKKATSLNPQHRFESNRDLLDALRIAVKNPRPPRWKRVVSVAAVCLLLAMAVSFTILAAMHVLRPASEAANSMPTVPHTPPPPNKPPEIIEVKVTPDPPRAGEALTVEVSAVDPDKDALSYRFRTRDASDWTDWDSSTEPRFKLPEPRVGRFELEVRARDAHGDISKTWSKNSNIPNRLPQVAVRSFEPQKPVAGGDLRVKVEASDPDDDEVTCQYRWYINAEPQKWQPVINGQIVLQDLEPGELGLKLQARDTHEGESPLFTMTWLVQERAWAAVFTNSIGMKLVLVPSGEFDMGSPKTEADHQDDEEPIHRVRIVRPFYLGAFEVTQAEYLRVMNDRPSYFSDQGTGKSEVEGQDTNRYPVESISWEQSQAFCEQLSKLEKKAYRLPTEAEWEYACRAGTATAYSVGATLTVQEANFGSNERLPGSLRHPAAVDSYAPNPFGLFNMHGNVWEWCADYFGERYYSVSPVDNPKGSQWSEDRIFRGGGFSSRAEDCRSANRNWRPPAFLHNYIGFRVLRDMTTEQD